MAHRSARELALVALREWRTGDSFADAILARLLQIERSRRRQIAHLPPNCSTASCAISRLLDFWIASLRSEHLDRRHARFIAARPLPTFSPRDSGARRRLRNRRARRREDSIPRQRRSAKRTPQKDGTRGDGETSRDLSVRNSHPQFLIDRWMQNFGAERHRGSMRVEQSARSDLRPDQSAQDFRRRISLAAPRRRTASAARQLCPPGERSERRTGSRALLHSGSKHRGRVHAARSPAGRKRPRRLRGARRENRISRRVDEKSGHPRGLRSRRDRIRTLQDNLERLGVADCPIRAA